MKSFWKKHWKWLAPTLAAAAALIVAVFLYFLGFRITYDPTIITNWDAVSGCAAWVSVVVSIAAVVASIVAIFYAIRVPKEIANQQDKIALFEKRLECYLAFVSITEFAAVIEKENSASKIKDDISFVLHLQDRTCDDVGVDILPYFWNLENRVTTFDFLFPNCKSRILLEALGAIEDLTLNVFAKEDGNDALTEEDIKDLDTFLKLTKEFKEKYLKLIRETLNM